MHGGERIGTLPRLPYTGFTCIYRATNDQVLRNVTDITVSRSYTEDAFIVCPADNRSRDSDANNPGM